MIECRAHGPWLNVCNIIGHNLPLQMKKCPVSILGFTKAHLRRSSAIKRVYESDDSVDCSDEDSNFKPQDTSNDESDFEQDKRRRKKKKLTVIIFLIDCNSTADHLHILAFLSKLC